MFWGRVEYIVGKGENAGNQHFLLFSQSNERDKISCINVSYESRPWKLTTFYLFCFQVYMFYLFYFQVYWVGPIVGGVLAALVYEYIFAASASFSRTKKFVLRHRKPAEKPAPANQDELNSSKAGLIEVHVNQGTKIPDERILIVVIMEN